MNLSTVAKANTVAEALDTLAREGLYLFNSLTVVDTNKTPLFSVTLTEDMDYDLGSYS